MNEEIKDTTVDSTSESKVDNEIKDTTDDQQDIDFKKVAADLESQTPPKKSKYSPEEKVKRSLTFIADQAKELGVDPKEVLGIKDEESEEVDLSNFVTKTDLEQQKARSLAKSDDEFKVMNWWMVNKGLNAEDAHFMANKPRLQSTFAEIVRGSVKAPAGDGESSGQKPKIVVAPDRHPSHQTLLNRGYRQVKQGLYQAKFYQERYDENSKTWVTEKITKSS